MRQTALSAEHMTAWSSPAGRSVADISDQEYSIGELAREFGVTLRSLRFYEDKRLLAPRRDGSNRIYSERDRGRLQLILLGKRVGFTLAEIKTLLDLHERSENKERQMLSVLEMFDDQIDVLKSQLDEIQAGLEELIDVRAGVARDLETARQQTS